jgi:hypothetical protein
MTHTHSYNDCLTRNNNHLITSIDIHVALATFTKLTTTALTMVASTRKFGSVIANTNNDKACDWWYVLRNWRKPNHSLDDATFCYRLF